MKSQNDGLHHFHYRKRLAELKSLSKNPLHRFLDRIIYAVGIIGPIMTIPQVMKIFMEKSAQGVSLVSWISYTINSIIWVLYGVVHKEKPIILTFSLWVVLDLIIVIGTIMYG